VRAAMNVGMVLALSGLALSIGSCGQGTRAGRGEDDNAPVRTGLAAMERGDSPTPRATTPDPNAEPEPGSVDAMARQSAIDLERALAATPSDSGSTGTPARRTGGSTGAGASGAGTGAESTVSDDGSGVSVGLVNVERGATSTGAETGAQQGAPAPSVSAGLSEMGGAQAAGVTLDERIRAASDDLSHLLSERAATSTTPLADLAIASALAAGVGEPVPDMSLGSAQLAPSERAAVVAVHGLVGTLKSGTSEGGSGADVADALQKSADEASAGLPLRITDAKLCTRVNGFGDYSELDVNAFLAGRASPVIVYAQVDRFMSRPGAGGRQIVEMSQELNIYHEADGAHCWKRPAQTVTESTRTRRRDFYLTNAIELPSTLTVGKYRLKVTMRDATGGGTAETTIPFSIVADPALAHTAE
jgi:hypothetical protein